MTVRARAPLRLGFSGGGTDVEPYSSLYGGAVLNTTIDLYAYCTIDNIEEGVVFEAIDIGKKFKSESLKSFVYDGCLDLHKGVYNFIVKKYNNNIPLSLKVTTYSDAPPGSGVGTSSAMVVAILKAYVEWLNLPIDKNSLAEISYFIERSDLGFHGGRQDQFATAFGGFNFMEFYGEGRTVVNSLEINEHTLNELETSMILYYTGTSRKSADIICEQIQNTKNQSKNSLEAAHKVKLDAFSMKEALLKGDVQEFAKILGHSWQSKKRMADSITNQKIDRVYDRAIKAGAYSGKISGAGGGGFMIFIASPLKKYHVVKALEDMGGFTINFHFVQQGAHGWTGYE